VTVLGSLMALSSVASLEWNISCIYFCSVSAICHYLL